MRLRKAAPSRLDTRSRASEERAGLRAIVVLQQTLFWTTAYVLASTTYMIVTHTFTTEVLPTAIVLVASGATLIIYLFLHNATTILTSRAPTTRIDKARVIGKWLAINVLRLAVTLWLAACGLVITFTLAHRSDCTPGRPGANGSINIGTTCIIQRIGIGASLVALLASSALFVLINKVSTPFRAHAFGILTEPVLPFKDPYKHSRDRCLYSEMSFKCQSSRSNSSSTLVKSRQSSVGTVDRQAIGLGIYAPKQHFSTFLTPRPSLSSIRTHTTVHSYPQSRSPLPPMPAYIPSRYRRLSETRRAVQPPRSAHPYSSCRPHSQGPVRIVPPSPVLSAANLDTLSRTDSFSSIYSRSVSGTDLLLPKPRVLGLHEHRNVSTASSATLVRSPLAMMSRASGSQDFNGNGSSARSSSTSAQSSDIDDAATLQSRLPPVQVWREFGNVARVQPRRQPVQIWRDFGTVDTTAVARRKLEEKRELELRMRQMVDDEFAKTMRVQPLNVRKVSDGDVPDNWPLVQGIA